MGGRILGESRIPSTICLFFSWHQPVLAGRKNLIGRFWQTLVKIYLVKIDFNNQKDKFNWN
jgi:hypothetical protein